MTGVRHVIFDLDGTLVDSAPHCAAILNAMLDERGSSRRVSAADARDHLTRGGKQIVAALLGDECRDLNREVADFRARYRTLPTPPECLYPGVADGLRRLAHLGIRIAICSNKPQVLCEKIIHDLGFSGLVPVIAGSVDDKALKPAPDLALQALAAFGTTANQCLYVGDSEVDRLTAAAAGIPFLFVSYGYAEPDFELGDTPSVASFDAAVSLVADGASGFQQVA